MEHLEKLTKVLRYAGLNLNPQILSVVLDDNVTKLIKTLDAKLKEGELSLEAIDVIVAEIQEAAEATAKAAEESAKNVGVKSKAKTKPTAKLDKK